MRPGFVLLFFCIISLTGLAQKETSNWFFDPSQGLSFNTGTPMQITGIPVNNSGIASGTSMSDANGNLLFIYTGAFSSPVLDKNYQPMPGPTPIFNGGDNNVLAAKYPGSSSKFLLFYPRQTSSEIYSLYYATIDMSLNGGLGQVIDADNIIDLSISHGYTIINKKGTDDIWIVTNKYRTDLFTASLFDASGLSAAKQISKAGLNSASNEYNLTTLKASPDGNMFVGSTSTYYPANFSYYANFFEVFNFDSQTGSVSTKIKSRHNVTGAVSFFEFSPDNKLLYVVGTTIVTGLQPCGFASSAIFQYDLCYTDSVSLQRYAVVLGNILTFCYFNYWGNIQVAPDKKIYFRQAGDFLLSIDFPNRRGTSAKFNSNSITTESGSGVSLPSFYQHDMEKPIKNNIVYSGGCHPDPLNFSITNDTIINIQWNFGDPSSGSQNTALSQNASHVFSAPGFYQVTASLSNSANVFIETIKELVEIKDPAKRILYGFPTDTSFCAGNSLKIKLSVNNGIYEWSNKYQDGPTYITGISDSILIEGTSKYYVRMLQDGCGGCEKIDSINVTVLPVPYVGLGSDKVLCPNDSLQIGVYDYDNTINCVWSTGETTDSIWVKKAGSYSVVAEISNNGCPKFDTINVAFNPPIIFSLPKDTTLCNGQSLLLVPEVAGAQYLWQDNSTAATYNVLLPGTYWLNISKDGCSKADSIVVSYVTADQVALGADTSLCQGNSLTLAANVPNAAYQWSNGSTAASIIVNNSGQYNVKVATNGCTATDTINVLFTAIPYFSLGTDTALCTSQTLALSTQLSGGNYVWQDASTLPAFTVAQAGTYWLAFTKDGCTFRDSILINYKQTPPIYLGADTSVCTGAAVLLDAYGSTVAAYLWQDGSKQNNFTAISAGNYYVKITGLNGCINSDTVIISQKPYPVFSLGADTTICSGTSITLVTNLSSVRQSWSDGSLLEQLLVSAPGVYWVDVNKDGCTKRDSIIIKQIAAPTVYLGKDTTLCNTAKLLLSAANSNATYLWNDGIMSAAYLVDKPGIYTVVVNKEGCTAKSTIVVTYHYTPQAALGADKEICDGAPIVLSSSSFGDNYLWQDGATAATYTARVPGLYTLSISNECGISQDSILLTKGRCKLFVPVAFTPNQDGLNDFFKVSLGEPIINFKLVIYNRYGQLIFQDTNKQHGWDGTFKGVPQEASTYVWILSYTSATNNKTENVKGSLLLIR